MGRPDRQRLPSARALHRVDATGRGLVWGRNFICGFGANSKNGSSKAPPITIIFSLNSFRRKATCGLLSTPSNRTLLFV